MTSGTEHYWYKIEKNKNNKKVKKIFKSFGSPNGDVLESEPGCCAVFTSTRSQMIIEWCQKTMRYKIGNKKWV